MKHTVLTQYNHYIWNHIDNLCYQCWVFWPQNHYIWYHMHAISVSTSIILIMSHQLYWWDLIHYIWWHHIHYIWYHPYCFIKTKRLYLSSHPLYWYHSHRICVVTPALSMSSQLLWESSHSSHLWHHAHPTSHQIQTLWHPTSLFRTSQTLHSWHQISYIWHHINGL